MVTILESFSSKGEEMTVRIKDGRNSAGNMLHVPLCCKFSTAAGILFAAAVLVGHFIADVEASTTSSTTTTTTSKPFLKSPLFIGLAAGVGGFIGFLVLLCLLWKCCCTSDD